MEGRPPESADAARESDLVERARGGDVGAYESLVEEYQTIAFRTAYLITGSAADAEEAAQDGFVKAHAALRRFRRGAPFRPWLLAIVANEARNRRRSARRRAELALRAAEAPPTGDAAPSPEAALLQAEERQRLLAAVNELGDDDRLVDRVPLLRRALRGRDGGRDRPARGHGQVAGRRGRSHGCGNGWERDDG